MFDVTVSSTLPTITINYDQLRAALEADLVKYRGVVVTEETLQDCKAARKDLAGMRAKIDAHRKEEKRRLSEPVAAFEGLCKELCELVKSVEAPLQEGIDVFDGRRREEKRAVAESVVREVASEMGLREEYAARLDVLDSYCNLTAKRGDVKSDAWLRATALKERQDADDERLEIVSDAITRLNERTKGDIDPKGAQRLIDAGTATKDILAVLEGQSQAMWNAEHMEEPEPEPAPEEARISPLKRDPEPEVFVKAEISGGLREVQSVLDFMKTRGVRYKILEKGRRA
jgi:hypothetical protein